MKERSDREDDLRIREALCSPGCPLCRQLVRLVDVNRVETWRRILETRRMAGEGQSMMSTAKTHTYPAPEPIT